MTLAQIWCWLAQIWCWLRWRHTYVLATTGGLHLRCESCGHETPGFIHEVGSA